MASYRIAVVGDKDSVLGFQALGLDVFPAEGPEEARAALHRLLDGAHPDAQASLLAGDEDDGRGERVLIPGDVPLQLG